MNTVVHSVCSLDVSPAFSLRVVPAWTCTPATDHDLESVIDSSSWLKKNTCPVTCPRMVAELVATTEREFVLTWLRLWSGHMRQPFWVALVRTLASSAPSCPDRAHEWCRVFGTVWRRTVRYRR